MQACCWCSPQSLSLPLMTAPPMMPLMGALVQHVHPQVLPVLVLLLHCCAAAA